MYLLRDLHSREVYICHAKSQFRDNPIACGRQRRNPQSDGERTLRTLVMEKRIVLDPGLGGRILSPKIKWPLRLSSSRLPLGCGQVRSRVLFGRTPSIYLVVKLCTSPIETSPRHCSTACAPSSTKKKHLAVHISGNPL
jgi:hypothetical protein